MIEITKSEIQIITFTFQPKKITTIQCILYDLEIEKGHMALKEYAAKKKCSIRV